MEIRLEHVSSFDQISSLQDISEEFSANKVYGIIGKSGSGKSHFGKILAGRQPLQQGQIYYDNLLIQPISNHEQYLEIQKKVGYVAEDLDFIMVTVFEELAKKIKEQHYRESELEKRVFDALKMVGLSHTFIDRNPRTLSTGEQRKLALAKALICNPKVVVLDEPSFGFDPFEQKKLAKLIRMLKIRYHKIVIIISNDLDFMLPVVDHILVMEDGKVKMNQAKYQVLKATRKLKNMGIQVPKMIEFSDIVLKKKKIKMGYRDQMNDLIKDIYRYAEWGCHNQHHDN